MEIVGNKRGLCVFTNKGHPDWNWTKRARVNEMT